MTHWTHVLTAFIQYTGLIVLIGALATRNIKDIYISPAFSATIQSRANSILVIALIALTFCAPIVLAIRATMMTGNSVKEILPALPTLLLHTHYGLIWLIRCALLLCSWLLVLPLIKTNKQWPGKLMFIVAAFIAWTLSAVGHASGWDDFSWQQLTDWLHIISASLWAGGMLSTLFVIWPLLHVDSCQNFINHTALRLSRLATKVFIITIATGLVNLYLQLSAPSDLVNTSYGQILSIKIILVLMMLYFAFINRYLYLAQLQQEAIISDNWSKIARFLLFFAPGLQRQLDKTASQHFFQILILETLCLFAVLVCTSILRHGPPPPHMMM
jgi:copper resistance protein D